MLTMFEQEQNRRPGFLAVHDVRMIAIEPQTHLGGAIGGFTMDGWKRRSTGKKKMGFKEEDNGF